MVQEWKKKMAQQLAEEIKQYKVVGIADIYKLPSSQYQEIKHKIKDKANIRVVKKRVLMKAFELANMPEKAKEVLESSIITGLILSNENPFKLYKFTEKNKSLTFAKAGDIAPQDIIVPEGDTGLPPGPIIGELKAAGIKARIQGNSIVVQEDSLVVKKGEEINEQVANILMKLNIKPIEIGINISAMIEEGIVYEKSILAVDEQQYFEDVVAAANQAFNLAYHADYPIKEVVELKVVEAAQNAFNLAYNADYVTKEVIDALLQKANTKAYAVASELSKDARKELGIDVVAVAGAAPVAAGASAEAPAEAKEEKKEEKEEKSEEEAAAGLGALFG